MKKIFFTYLELYTRQFCPVFTYLSQELTFSILTMISLQYLAGCFPLFFLEGHYSFLSPEITSLYLDSMIWDFLVLSKKVVFSVRMSYASPLIWKLHPCGEVTSKIYKPAFHGSHLSRNISHGSAVTIQVFCLPQQRYSYSTQSSMTKLLLSVSQH